MMIKYSKQFKKDLKKYRHNKKVLDELEKVTRLLFDDKPLPRKYDLHELSGKLSGTMDCHLFGDDILLYTIGECITFSRIGNHNNLKLTESIFKLKISEDTACVASKTSYIDEDGLDKNGIYYFGDKPKLPVNWKDYKKDDNKKYGLKEGSTMKLRINESIADENGMFMQMDDAMEGLIGNVSDSDINEVVRYYSTVSGKLGKKDKYSSIYCYFSNESWLDPLENKSDFDLTPVYKNGKYDAYICNSKYGKFIVDHFSNNFDFTMYATDESIIDNVLKDIELKYE